MERCPWAKTPIEIEYHDREWGVPVHDEHRLFEHLVLDGAQAGLSWYIILKKRENYRVAFDHFDPAKVARYRPAKIEKLLANPGIVRNRLKINSAVTNARAFLQVQEEFGSFDAYIWRFTDGQPVTNHRRSPKDFVSRSPLSDAVSKDLSRRGFKFVGSTIMYAMMQAMGMINDHLVACPRHQEVHTIRGTNRAR